MTAAATTALRERLKRLRQAQDTALSEQLLSIGRECTGHRKEPFHSIDHGDLLYDDKGLPR